MEPDDTDAVPLDEMPDADVIAALVEDPTRRCRASERAAACAVRCPRRAPAGAEAGAVTPGARPQLRMARRLAAASMIA